MYAVNVTLPTIPALIGGETSGQLFIVLSHAPPSQAPSLLVQLVSSSPNVTFSPPSVILTTAQGSFTASVATGAPDQTVIVSAVLGDVQYFIQPPAQSLRVFRTGHVYVC